jgi:hypothetical protein
MHLINKGDIMMEEILQRKEIIIEEMSTMYRN